MRVKFFATCQVYQGRILRRGLVSPAGAYMECPQRVKLIDDNPCSRGRSGG